MSLQRLYELGTNAALEKLAVSGAAYARALQSTAARRGATMPASLHTDIGARPRAHFDPDYSAVSRSPGAMMPTPEQRQLRAFTGQLQTGAAGSPVERHQELRNKALFGIAGHQYHAAPDMDAAIAAMARPPREPDAMRRRTPALMEMDSTRRGKAPAPRLPLREPGAAKTRSFEAFEPTATMPEHLYSIPGMPAYRP